MTRHPLCVRHLALLLGLVTSTFGVACGDDHSRVVDAGGGGVDAGPAADVGPGVDTGPGMDTGPGVDVGPGVDGGGGVDAPAPTGGPDSMGPHAVTTRMDSVTRGDRTTPVVAHVPAGGGPLVLFLPGFQLESRRYVPLAERVASHGFVVVRADPSASLFSVSHVDMRDDAIAVLDWAEEALADVVTEGTGVMGHSLGGKLSVMVAGADARVGAVLGIDPVNGGAGPSGYTATAPDIVPEVSGALAMPVGYMGEITNASGGFMPCAPADQNYTTFYDSAGAAPWAAEWTFDGADHMDFVSDTSGCGFTCSACPNGSADQATVQAGMLTLAVAFFRRHLRADAAMDGYLTGAMVPGGITTRSR